MGDEEATRERRIRLIDDLILPRLPDPDWADDVELDDEELNKSSRVLAEAYYDFTVPLVVSVLLLIGLLFVVDVAFVLSMQVYGLYIDIFAGIFFVTPGLKAPSEIAFAVESRPPAIRRMESEDMVLNNVGFVTLLVGFALQIVAVQAQASELFTHNYLTWLPTWSTMLGLVLSGLISFFVLGRLRDRRKL